ncbi:hypothetical protein KIPB_005060 [Kipferlia bialata]|uniref:Protein kinase domain-containing protein n=1 Tax=Kipferlia bialata TaxID=797122 RepID=A0A9K3CUT6_9EUKA|nr:hypothetical protein KIPB_005060 [Kipferlia bialata]|eukprot:g5060.t1
MSSLASVGTDMPMVEEATKLHADRYAELLQRNAELEQEIADMKRQTQDLERESAEIAALRFGPVPSVRTDEVYNALLQHRVKCMDRGEYESIRLSVDCPLRRMFYDMPAPAPVWRGDTSLYPQMGGETPSDMDRFRLDMLHFLRSHLLPPGLRSACDTAHLPFLRYTQGERTMPTGACNQLHYPDIGVHQVLRDEQGSVIEESFHELLLTSLVYLSDGVGRSFTPAEKGQVMENSKRLYEVHSARAEIVSLLLSPDRFMVFSTYMRRGEYGYMDSISYQGSVEYSLPENLGLLSQVLARPAPKLGLVFPKQLWGGEGESEGETPIPPVTLQFPSIGRGGTWVAFNATHHTSQASEAVHDCDNTIEGVIKITHRTLDPNHGSQWRIDEEMATLRHLHTLDGVVHLVDVPLGPGACMVQPRGTRVGLEGEPNRWTVAHSLHLLTTLDTLHRQYHTVNRDISPCNVALDLSRNDSISISTQYYVYYRLILRNDGVPRSLLFDFSTAVKVGERHCFEGTLAYASYRVLYLLYAGDHHRELVFEPQDDMASLVRLTKVFLDLGTGARLGSLLRSQPKGREDPVQLVTFWAEELAEHPWRALEEAAVAGDVPKMREVLEGMQET